MRDGSLSGVPFLIKDFGPMAEGVPFYCGSHAVPGIHPDHDSDPMTRVRAAGLVTLGSTTAPEFGVEVCPQSPYAPARPATPGTSTEASAAPAAVPGIGRGRRGAHCPRQ